MRQSKTLNMLRTLTAWERRHFEDYLRSPFHNKNEMVIAFWEFLLPFAPDFEDEQLEMEQVFPHFFPDEAYDHQKLRYLMTDLNRLCEEFLAYQDWREDENSYAQHLIEALGQRHLVKPYEAHSRKIKKRFQRQEERNTDSFLEEFRFVEQQFVRARRKLKGQVKAPEVQEVLGALDELFLVKKLRYVCELINRATVVNEPPADFLAEEIMAGLKDSPERGGVLVRMYYLVLLTLTEGENEQHFRQLKQRLFEQGNQIDASELSDLYEFAINYCIKQANQGKPQYFEELFSLYQQALEEKILLYEDKLDLSHFKNIVTVGIRQQAYNWTEDFIDRYRLYLPEEEAENAFTYNMAILQEARGNYRQVKRLLLAVEFTDERYALGARSVLVRTYYDLEDFEMLRYQFSSFRMYLHRNRKISAVQKELHLNLIRITQKLVRYQEGGSISLEEIQDQISRTSHLASRRWLERKVKELGGGN